jgi:hypothetical protein
MKSLPIPAYDDEEAITNTANNNRLRETSFPHLRNQLDLVLNQYEHYINENGNAWVITAQVITEELKIGLKANYKTPPTSLSFIPELRNSSPDVCPMCGKPSTATLDHFFPKEDFPEWTVFSKNLIPACDCNIKRGQVLKGDPARQERVLHPYFDTLMLDRQISCLITSTDNFRLVDITVFPIDEHHAEINSIKFHIEKIILPSGIVNWIGTKWDNIRMCPHNILHTLPRDLLNDQNQLITCLEDLLDRQDQAHGTPNNWQSILVHGILNSPGVVPWLFNRHNSIISGTIDPLND